jgi:hypothetical protein
MHSFGAYILIGFQRPPCFCRISCGAVILQFRTALPPIFAAYILRKRLHFEQTPIFYACVNILSKHQYFDDFCNEFCLILLLQIFVYISVFYLCICQFYFAITFA